MYVFHVNRNTLHRIITLEYLPTLQGVRAYPKYFYIGTSTMTAPSVSYKRYIRSPESQKNDVAFG